MRSYPKLIDRFPYLAYLAIEGEPVRTKPAMPLKENLSGQRAIPN
jgi:hypothetical protein